MSAAPFVHLHCHSHYSLLDGAATIDRLIDRAGVVLPVREQDDHLALGLHILQPVDGQRHGVADGRHAILLEPGQFRFEPQELVPGQVSELGVGHPAESVENR